MLKWLTIVALTIGKWLVNPSGWQYRHFWTSPFGASALTITWSNQWMFWPDWNKVSDMVGLGVISYGVVAVVAEGGLVGMWYALSKIGKDLEERRRRRQEEAAGNFVAAIKAVESRPDRARIVQAAEDNGISRDVLRDAALKAGVVLPGERRRSRRRRSLPTTVE